MIWAEHDQYWSEDKTKKGIENRSLIMVNSIHHPPALSLKWEHSHYPLTLTPLDSICHIPLNKTQWTALEPLPLHPPEAGVTTLGVTPPPDTPLRFLSKKYASRDAGEAFREGVRTTRCEPNVEAGGMVDSCTGV